MTLDLVSLTFALLLAVLTLAASVLVVATQPGPSRGPLVWWGAGLMLHGAGYLAFLLRFAGWPVLSIVAVNGLLAATLSAHAYAIARFQGVDLRRAWSFGPILVSCVAAWLLSDVHAARNLVAAGLVTAQTLLLVRLAWLRQPGEPMPRGQLLLIGAYLLLAATFVVRAAAIAFAFHEPGQTSTVTDAIQSWTYVAGLSVVIGNTLGFLTMHKERAERRLRDEATHDALTGVANRRALLQALEREWSLAHRTRAPLAVVLADIDWFKQVNDHHGHLVGDRVLAGVAQRFAQRLRVHDTVGRYGGEEFLVVLPATDLPGAHALAESLRVAVEAPFDVDGLAVKVTVSLGVAVIPGVGEGTPEALVAAADRALYRAKEAGRNRVVVAD